MKPRLMENWTHTPEVRAVANPSDPNSIDKAISNNYRVVYGSEMGKEEWANVRKYGVVESSSAKFGSIGTDEYEYVKPTDTQVRIGEWVKKVAYELQDIRIDIKWIRSMKVSASAEYGGRTVTFNLLKIRKEHWELKDGMVEQDLLKLIIHELGHEKGMHYEMSYHEEVIRLGVSMVMLMKEDKEWFKI